MLCCRITIIICACITVILSICTQCLGSQHVPIIFFLFCYLLIYCAVAVLLSLLLACLYITVSSGCQSWLVEQCSNSMDCNTGTFHCCISPLVCVCLLQADCNSLWLNFSCNTTDPRTWYDIVVEIKNLWQKRNKLINFHKFLILMNLFCSNDI